VCTSLPMGSPWRCSVCLCCACPVPAPACFAAVASSPLLSFPWPAQAPTVHLNYRLFEVAAVDPVTHKPVSLWWFGGPYPWGLCGFSKTLLPGASRAPRPCARARHTKTRTHTKDPIGEAKFSPPPLLPPLWLPFSRWLRPHTVVLVPGGRHSVSPAAQGRSQLAGQPSHAWGCGGPVPWLAAPCQQLACWAQVGSASHRRRLTLPAPPPTHPVLGPHARTPRRTRATSTTRTCTRC
jgi:hypothetical protein